MMKKSLCLLLFLFSCSLSLRAENDSIERLKQTVSERATQYFLSYPAILNHVYGAFYEGLAVIKEGIADSDQIAAKYPHEKEVHNYLNSVESLRSLLSREDVIVKGGAFLFLGVYDRRGHVNDKLLKDLQFKIFSYWLERSEIDQALAKGQLTEERAQLIMQDQDELAMSDSPYAKLS